MTTSKLSLALLPQSAWKGISEEGGQGIGIALNGQSDL